MAENSGRNRLFLMIGLAVLVVVGGFLLFRSSTKERSAQVKESVSLTPPPAIDPIPGTSDSKEYSDTVVLDNARRAQEAQEAQRTSLPTLVEQQSGGTVFNDTQIPVEPKPLPAQPTNPVVAPPTAPGQTPARAQRPARAPEEQQRSVAGMEEKIKAMQEQWALRPAFQEFAYLAAEPEEQLIPSASGQGSQGAAGDQDSNGSNEEAKDAPALILAGTIVPAVLLGPVNSDNPGPVLAQIVAGPLRGARVLGTFQLRRKHVVLEFSTLSWPKTGRSMSISAYGVNDDASLGMATDVNNHYFLRYGLTLAAAFVQGYGEAASRANTTVVISPIGVPIEQRGELTNEQIRQSALGNVGSTLGSQLQQEANIPPTITVDAQAPIGLLFMADF